MSNYIVPILVRTPMLKTMFNPISVQTRLDDDDQGLYSNRTRR